MHDFPTRCPESARIHNASSITTTMFYVLHENDTLKMMTYSWFNSTVAL